MLHMLSVISLQFSKLMKNGKAIGVTGNLIVAKKKSTFLNSIQDE